MKEVFCIIKSIMVISKIMIRKWWQFIIIEPTPKPYFLIFSHFLWREWCDRMLKKQQQLKYTYEKTKPIFTEFWINKEFSLPTCQWITWLFITVSPYFRLFKIFGQRVFVQCRLELLLSTPCSLHHVHFSYLIITFTFYHIKIFWRRIVRGAERSHEPG